ncbi:MULTISPECIES: hypothetical protein [Methylobacterium]|uniref:Glycine zipper 2TM domain protein n=2 Tax=Methylobacterium jeotgali TaxID=381630 RepID=A0ABQ4T2S1_9HYPH|nr:MULTISPECIES: hypothetical protein [Methylobacterium]PIU08018.1 MAG: hypothetical protein COT56_03025 [Methylobacterium sp. CG09_land_8_20_14_0_10_71_15]PIU15804.1 MAG: hypothetical protein COT28_03070 [Methylobacterium sp. CG08_land_8_20_14_0_20_71_15]GBU17915.1 hypothetical protein AwMethylo_21300 [Methylobacterium sp.]GJE08555.1 hypothetical protein AOPFMNJM_3895 [Methylobacterium jeotgali]
MTRATNRTLTLGSLFGAALAVLALAPAAEAKGCLKGAAVGGIAGHMAGHGVVGAAAGCAVGRHRANKKAAKDAQTQQGQDVH